MKRLTRRFEDDGRPRWNIKGGSGEAIAEIHQKALYRLCELEDKFDSGELQELPCDIDTHLFILHLPNLENEIIECFVTKMEFSGVGIGWRITACEYGLGTRRFVFGWDARYKNFSGGVDGYPRNEIFYTREKAEKRVKELNGSTK